jgi:hypothetical protein
VLRVVWVSKSGDGRSSRLWLNPATLGWNQAGQLGVGDNVARDQPTPLCNR